MNDTGPEWVCGHISEYSDVFHEGLPDGPPTARAMQAEVAMKPDANLSLRSTFLLSKTDQEALDKCGANNLQKLRVEVTTFQKSEI